MFLSPWTKVSLDQCLLGQKSSWTNVPWTNCSLDNCPLDKCINTHIIIMEGLSVYKKQLLWLIFWDFNYTTILRRII